MSRHSLKILLPLLLLGYSGLCQDTFDDTTPSKPFSKWHSYYRTFEANYGILLFQKGNILDSLNAKHGFSIPNVQTVGSECKTLLNVNRKYVFDASLSYHFSLPVHMENNGTEMDMWSFQWGLMLYGKDFLYKKKRLDAVVGIGFNQGFGFLSTTQNDTIRKYNNPYFAPKVTAELRGTVWKLSLGTRAEYQIDVSKKAWKTKSDVSIGNVPS
ncbi:MAG: hypothetical protein GC178_15700 [Flavobacteriales bacterium]|nr:hypothetical protein [Flavobacteriales bacterium]